MMAYEALVGDSKRDLFTLEKIPIFNPASINEKNRAILGSLNELVYRSDI